MFNTSAHPGRPDSITLYDGDIYNISASVLATIEVGGGMERKLFKTNGPKLSVKLFANGGSNIHGFIAEIVTLPISAIGFSMFTNCVNINCFCIQIICLDQKISQFSCLLKDCMWHLTSR